MCCDRYGIGLRALGCTLIALKMQRDTIPKTVHASNRWQQEHAVSSTDDLVKPRCPTLSSIYTGNENTYQLQAQWNELNNPAAIYMDALETSLSCSAHDADGKIECPTCGCELLCLATSVAEDNEDLRTECTGDESSSESPPEKKAAKKPTPAKKPAVDRSATPRGLKRFKPGVTQVKEIRKAIRVEMLACIPGWNRARARAVIDAHPSGTLREIMGSPLGHLACIKIGQSSTLGTELAQALQLVIE